LAEKRVAQLPTLTYHQNCAIGCLTSSDKITVCQGDNSTEIRILIFFTNLFNVKCEGQRKTSRAGMKLAKLNRYGY
jgi:hypothetical protein